MKLISREDVLALYKREQPHLATHVWEFEDMLKDIPVVEDRKTGKWVLAEMGDTDLYECSLCRNRKTYVSPFCDICGAKMEGEENAS